MYRVTFPNLWQVGSSRAQVEGIAGLAPLPTPQKAQNLASYTLTVSARRSVSGMVTQSFAPTCRNNSRNSSTTLSHDHMFIRNTSKSSLLWYLDPEGTQCFSRAFLHRLLAGHFKSFGIRRLRHLANLLFFVSCSGLMQCLMLAASAAKRRARAPILTVLASPPLRLLPASVTCTHKQKPHRTADCSRILTASTTT